MEKIKEKLQALRIEADTASTRGDEAEAKVKKLEQALLERDNEITSLNRKIAVLETDLEKSEAKVTELKSSSGDADASRSNADSLNRKVQLLEEELDAAEKNVKETVEKLRQVDVKAEHFERQLVRAEQERDQWEKKAEEATEKHKKAQKELDELVSSMEGL